MNCVEDNLNGVEANSNGVDGNSNGAEGNSNGDDGNSNGAEASKYCDDKPAASRQSNTATSDGPSVERTNQPSQVLWNPFRLSADLQTTSGDNNTEEQNEPQERLVGKGRSKFCHVSAALINRVEDFNLTRLCPRHNATHQNCV